MLQSQSWVVDKVAALHLEPNLWALLEQGPEKCNDLQSFAQSHLIG